MDMRMSELAARLGKYGPLSRPELDHLASMQSIFVKVRVGKELMHEGQSDHCAYILHKGWACNFKILQDGSRQIIGFSIAGDCIGLCNIMLPTSFQSLVVLTDAVVSRIDVPHMSRILREFPRLGSAMLSAVCEDEATLIEHLVSVGRRTPMQRLAHLVVELHERLLTVGLATETQFRCPLNQYVLADALGLSAIHVNRVLRQLRELNLFVLSKRTATLMDVAGLKALAGYKQ